MTDEKNNKRVQKEKPIVKGTHKKTAPKKNTPQKKFLKMGIDEAREKFKNIRI